MANCPAGFDCVSMVGSRNVCPNLETCLRSGCGESFVADDLSDFNPHLMQGRRDHFVVFNHSHLPDGYAVAVPANLPAVVVKGHIEAVADDRGYQRAECNREFFFEIDYDPIVLIEWMVDAQGGREIRQIFTESNQHDVHERKDGSLLCTQSDHDPIEGEYWLRDDQPAPDTYGAEAKQVSFPAGTDLDKLKAQLKTAYTYEDIFYCKVCQDYTYESAYGWSACQHLRYVEHLSSWGGVGYAEDAADADYAESFKAIIHLEDEDVQAVLPALHKALKEQNMESLQTVLRHLDCVDVEKCEPAIAFLETLNKGTPQGFQQCLDWFKQAKETV